MGDGLARGEAQAVDFGVLVDGCGVVAPIRGDHEDFGIRVAGRLGMPLGIAGGKTTFFG